MIIELNTQDPRWSEMALEKMAGDAAKVTLAHLGLQAGECEISLLACDNVRIAALNADFRGKGGATNVLSWPTTDLAAKVAGTDPDRPKPDPTGELALGDIAIAWEVCAQEAQDAGKEMADHVTHLLVHGVLHLLGYDHIRDLDATLMMKNEVEILGKLGISNPY